MRKLLLTSIILNVKHVGNRTEHAPDKNPYWGNLFYNFRSTAARIACQKPENGLIYGHKPWNVAAL